MADLTSDLLAALDPVELARSTGMEPDAWQRDVLRTQDKRLLLRVARQAGKTTVASILAVHRALYWPESTILVLSPGIRQSQLLFYKCASLYRKLGRPVPAEAENQLSLTLENRSRIVALPGDATTIRGFTADLLLVDEAATVSDDTWAAAAPMLAVSKGQCIAMGTPAGRRGWWWSAHQSSEWRQVVVTAALCPRISRDDVDEYRRLNGDWRTRQEYFGEFVDQYGSMFAGEDIEHAFALGRLSAVPPLFGASRVQRKRITESIAVESHDEPADEPAEEEPWTLGSRVPLPPALARQLNSWQGPRSN